MAFSIAEKFKASFVSYIFFLAVFNAFNNRGDSVGISLWFPIN